MKKILIPLSMIASSAIFAGDLDSRVTKLESNEAQTTTQSYAETTIARTALAYPVVKDSYKIKLEIGAVYQTIQVGGTEFGFAYTAEDLNNDYPIVGEVLEPKSKLTWGVNVAASYIPFLEEYDLRFANSYFENHSHLNKRTNNTSNFISAINYDIDWWGEQDVFDGVSSQLKAGYNLLGLEMGRSTSLSKKLAYRPFLGLLSSWMWLNQKTTYGWEDDARQMIELKKSQWFGIGPQAGLNTNFAINKFISIFLDSKGSLMYGSFKIRRLSGDTDELANDFLYVQNSKISDRKVIPYVEFILGGSYECFNKSETKHFKVRAGYHLQYFVSANQSFNNINGVRGYLYRANEDISTQGLILDLACSF